MKISKEVGRMALDALGTAPSTIVDRHYDLDVAFRHVGWLGRGRDSLFDEFFKPSDHSDTLLCLIASIAGVKP